MNSLREATAYAHHQAETTELMQLMLSGKMTAEHYAGFLANQLICYNAIERRSHLFADGDMARSSALVADITELRGSTLPIVPSVYQYADYVQTLSDQGVWAHIYVRYLGDMYGGRLIKSRVPGSGRIFEFRERDELISRIRLSVSIADAGEANRCFDWVIKIYDEFYNCIKTTS
jgi:heme oxygenase